MYEPARRNAVNSLILGVVLVFYGFLTSPVYLEGDVGIYNTTVDILFVVLRVGGLAFIIIAGLLFAGLRVALLFDVLTVGICGLALGACSLYWIALDGPDVQELLYLVFAVLFLRAAHSSFGAYRRGTPGEQTPGALTTDQTPSAAPASNPVHPASVHPETLPQEDQPPPPDGYLAALSKEKGESPDAGHR